MEMSDEPALQILQPQGKSTDFSACVICQSDDKVSLRKAKETSISNLIEAMQERNDDVFERLKPDIPGLTTRDVYWHAKCYSVYVSKHNIRYAPKRKLSVSPTPVSSESLEATQSSSSDSRSSRSKEVPFDTMKCMFCQKVTRKKVKDLFNVSTFMACKTILAAAEVRGDERMLLILRGINNDQCAAELKYHQNCHASYTSIKSVTQIKPETGNVTGYSKAFDDLTAAIIPKLKAGKAYDMTSLLQKYQGLLQTQDVVSDRYTRQNLKQRLKNRFGDEIVFHQPTDRSKPELVYSSSISIQGIINEAFRRSKDADVSMTGTSLPAREATAIPDEVSERTKLLYKAAMVIKSDINSSTGISIQPLHLNDLTSQTCKQVVPESLYWLLRWIISASECFEVNPSAECKNSADEKRIVMLGQDIVQCSTHGRVKTPKHASLAMSVRHLTGSKQLIKILNRMGHCCSYDETEVIDTSLAKESLAKAEEIGVVIPSNITPGKFIQFAGDNNDINEETLDGKQTTHATTLVIYQRGEFADVPARKIYADHSKRQKTLESRDVGSIMHEFGAFGKRPKVKFLVNKLETEWFNPDEQTMQKCLNLDLAWNVVRLLPQTLFSVEIQDAQEKEGQYVPGWSGFHARVFPSVPSATSIGYCPMINGNPTEYSTVYTVLKTVQKITESVGQAASVVTFDLAIYVKAKEIQWRVPDELKNVIIRMGGFHIALNYLSLLGKMYSDSGLEDLLIESGVYASGTTSALIAGKQYNRGVRAHKLTIEALFRLQWRAFVGWLSEQENTDIDLTALQNDIEVTRESFRMPDPNDSIDRLNDLIESLKPVQRMLDGFKNKGREESQTFAFWDNYIKIVSLLLSFIKAERTGNWELHLSATKAMTPYFFAMDRTNYSRWLPVYLVDMQTLDSVHPSVKQEFLNGNHAVSRSQNSFAQVWTDMALEQSVNLDSKSKGGIVGITQKPEALERWFLTCHERAAITSAIKEMCGIEDSERVGTHKESSLARIRRDEEDIQKLMEMFDSGMLSNPFTKLSEDNEVMPLINIATGAVMPRPAAERLIDAEALGKAQMDEFIAKRMKSTDISFWDTLPNLKIPLFGTLTKKRKVKVGDDKIVSVSADRELFSRLIIAAKARDIGIKEVLTYELSAVPFALVHSDGTLRKPTKSALLAVLEDDVAVSACLPQTDGQISTCLIIDGMALIQMMKTGGSSTFGDLSLLYFKAITAFFGQYNCSRIDIVFDSYRDMSIKAGEREKRGESAALEVKIYGPATPLPKQWDKYMTNAQNKRNLCDFLVESWCLHGLVSLEEGYELVIGGGFSDNLKAVSIKKGTCEDIVELFSDHEEADTRLLLHASHASRTSNRIVIQSPDTDVAVLGTAHFEKLLCEELWFKTGVRDNLRFIPIHQVCQKLGQSLCSALLGFHALTGCDSVSSFCGKGKKRPWDAVRQSTAHQKALKLLGKDAKLKDKTCRECEKFVCSLYTTNPKAGNTVNQVRYWLFCQKQLKNEGIPPTHDSLVHHLERSNYQTLVWKKALDAMQALPSPTESGWETIDESFRPVLMTQDSAPKGLVELTTCNCKTSACRGALCICRRNEISCTESCSCMADESCMNSFNVAIGSADPDNTE